MSAIKQFCTEHWLCHADDIKNCPYCEISALKERLASKEDAMCAARLLIEEYENRLAQWHSVFGHLSTDADKAGKLILEKQQELEAEVERLDHNYDVLKIAYDNLEQTHYETTYNRIQLLESKLSRYEQALQQISESDELAQHIASSALQEGI